MGEICESEDLDQALKKELSYLSLYSILTKIP